MTRPDIDRVTRLIEEAAAAEIMPRFQRLAAHDVREKAPGELVTIADEAVEARLAPLLTDLLPGSLVLGEEAAAVDRNLLDHLLGEHAVWVIDPVDGTGNFAEGRSAFALMVALVVAGRVRPAGFTIPWAAARRRRRRARGPGWAAGASRSRPHRSIPATCRACCWPARSAGPSCAA